VTARLDVRVSLSVDHRRVLEQVGPRLQEYLRDQVQRKKLVDTGRLRDGVRYGIQRHGRTRATVVVYVPGDRYIAALVHQSRTRWARIRRTQKRKLARGLDLRRAVRKRRRRRR